MLSKWKKLVFFCSKAPTANCKQKDDSNRKWNFLFWKSSGRAPCLTKCGILSDYRSFFCYKDTPVSGLMLEFFYWKIILLKNLVIELPNLYFQGKPNQWEVLSQYKNSDVVIIPCALKKKRKNPQSAIITHGSPHRSLSTCLGYLNYTAFFFFKTFHPSLNF